MPNARVARRPAVITACKHPSAWFSRKQSSHGHDSGRGAKDPTGLQQGHALPYPCQGTEGAKRMNATLAEMLSGQPATEARLKWLRHAGLEQKIVWIHALDGRVDCYQPLAQGLPSVTVAIEACNAQGTRGLTRS